MFVLLMAHYKNSNSAVSGCNYKEKMEQMCRHFSRELTDKCERNQQPIKKFSGIFII